MSCDERRLLSRHAPLRRAWLGQRHHFVEVGVSGPSNNALARRRAVLGSVPPSGASMARLSLTLLGGFQARLDSGPLTLPTKKIQALLAYLALPPGSGH